jgi:hypothetical protein
MSGVNIYTLRLRSGPLVLDKPAGGEKPPVRLSPSDFDMKALAVETGALSFFPSPTELVDVYASIASELSHQYSIGYEPANKRADGRYRRVAVRLVNRPDLRARTRTGYTADGRGTADKHGIAAGVTP